MHEHDYHLPSFSNPPVQLSLSPLIYMYIFSTFRRGTLISFKSSLVNNMRKPCCDKEGTNKGAWSKEEDQKLIDYITSHGDGCWHSLPKAAGLFRCGKSCRLRWINYLRPDIKRGNFDQDEEDLIIKLHALLGNRWSLIAGRLPGRTDNEVKNYWNSHIRRKLVRMGIDPNNHRLNRIRPMSNQTKNNKTVDVVISEEEEVLSESKKNMIDGCNNKCTKRGELSEGEASSVEFEQNYTSEELNLELSMSLAINVGEDEYKVRIGSNNDELENNVLDSESNPTTLVLFT